jgi:uncharacterized protein (TIGR02594 family)
MKLLKLICLITSILFIAGCANSPTRELPTHELNAVKYVGFHEISHRTELKNLMGVDPVYTQWCATFLNSVLELSNTPGSESVSKRPTYARSFLKWGIPVKTPKSGDIVIFKTGNSTQSGHVGIYIKTIVKNGKTYFRVLGGNQHNSVKFSEYRVSNLLGIRRLNSPLPKQRAKLSDYQKFNF